MSFEPITGRPVRFPPGKVEIRLDQRHYRMYRELYSRFGTLLDGLPVLRERDFDGRGVKVTLGELDALNRAFTGAVGSGDRPSDSVFGSQEASRTKLFKRLQYLS